MNLSLGFPEPASEFPEDLPAAGCKALDAAVTRFQAVQAPPDSPVRSIRHDPAAPGIYTEIPEGMAPTLRRLLEKRGIEKLYAHQGETFERVSAGRDVVVVTPTASGKTLCYNLPVMNQLLADPGARALYLFPTKAL